MKQIGRAILALAAVLTLHGCGGQDPGQPAIGSISVKSKSKDDAERPLVAKKATKADRKAR